MEFEPFSYMRHAKRLEYTAGIYMAGSGMPPAKVEDAGFTDDDYALKTLCASYGDPRNVDFIASRYKTSGNNVVLTQGSSEGYFLAFGALLEPGDKVIIETPGYQQFNSLTTFFGCRPVPLKRRFENKWNPDLKEFKRLLDDKTKIVVLTDLHNPTMSKMPPDLLKDMIAAAAKNGTTVIVGEVYKDHLKPGDNDESCFEYGDNVIATSSLTKVYGLSAIRFGWALAPERIAGRMLDVMDMVDPEMPAICQNLAWKALHNLPRMRAIARGIHERHWPIVEEWLKQRDDIEYLKPAGGITVWIHADGLKDTGNLVQVMRNEFGVLVVPGEYFQAPGWFRVGYKNPPGELRDGLSRIGRAIDDYRKTHKSQKIKPGK
ncbi:MAG: pyridoxal phosphate-dependent aminotransferase [Planctomycetes bacterium]|nr:pyridoxal phosphate-dependent aminotransferase [Planctomycetota bacterium]